MSHVLVPEHRNRFLIGRSRRSASSDHPQMPYLVSDLAYPGLVVGRLTPKVGQRRDQQILGLSSAGRSIGLADAVRGADVVTADSVILRVGAGPDVGVRAGRDGREGTVDRVRVVEPAVHQAL